MRASLVHLSETPQLSADQLKLSVSLPDLVKLPNFAYTIVAHPRPSEQTNMV